MEKFIGALVVIGGLVLLPFPSTILFKVSYVESMAAISLALAAGAFVRIGAVLVKD